VSFEPYGYDERQYCSPGFDLPIGCLMRGKWESYPEYHTSADNLDFLKEDRLDASLRLLCGMAEAIELGEERWKSLSPKGEPQLGPRGLYHDTEAYDRMTLLWVLNLADGRHTLLDMAERAGVKFSAIAAAADALRKGGLLGESRLRRGLSPEGVPC
jgi:aminopeptidase-like protein